MLCPYAACAWDRCSFICCHIFDRHPGISRSRCRWMSGPHLLWWLEDIHLCEGVSFGTQRPSLSVTTDASLSGWGAFCESRTLAGVWTAEEAESHINVLELEAVVRAVRALRDHAQGTSFTVFSDNTTVVAYINRQGGTRPPQLCLKVWSFLLWCRRHDIVVRATHVAGKDNTLADALSRGRASQGEWELDPGWADWLFLQLGRPNLDLFATAENTKLPVFCSRAFHPRAWAVDALSLSWDGLEAYAFPPFAIIHRVLLKIRASRTRVLLVAPQWPRQPWFPLLLYWWIFQCSCPSLLSRVIWGSRTMEFAWFRPFIFGQDPDTHFGAGPYLRLLLPYGYSKCRSGFRLCRSFRDLPVTSHRFL